MAQHDRPSRSSAASRNAVLNVLKNTKEVTTDELVRRTGISQPTILKVLSALQHEGLIERYRHGEPTGGRPPILYRYSAQAGTILGIEAELPVIRAALMDLAGNTLTTKQWTVDLTLETPQLIDALLSSIQHFADTAIPADTHLQTCGLAVTGFIDQTRGLWIGSARIDILQDIPIQQQLAAVLQRPVHLIHQIDALTLAEPAQHTVFHNQPFLYFDVAEGIGLRLANAGTPVTGMFGNAGLIGHTTVVPDGRRCVCGNHGCLEEYASARAFRRLLRELHDEHPHSALNQLGHPAVLSDAVQLMHLGDEHAKRIVDELVRFLAIGIANAVNVFEVTNVVLGGYIIEGGESLNRQLLHQTRTHLQPILGRNLNLVFSTASRDIAAPLGAAHHALQLATLPTPA
ncbi:putative transcriptional regulator, ROK family (plasmid) [Deinococcus deserti VCD115]|uniref:Putative transcriptional regulator, ROK family n=1 Tax=Deinococcus deserti (strain DSM 17065 / CIP 109153 / LMG 22923 / VCD115) TaxID=546414 RepID=C1D3G3_DEIDV|nr:putative transcriptional regulator, ROK family [Deinococcus deserti VCD115]